MLLCEDDPDVARAIADVLEAAGMQVSAVPSVRQAKIALDQARYDVALVDLHLADSDGLELVSDLRTHDATRALPVIVMTARARTSADAERFSTLQLADWLQKPIDPSRLLDAIHNVLLELRGRRARILHVEDDESLTELVEELLSDEAEVVRAHSLAQARAHVEAGGFDLVILDAALGDGSGLDLLPTLHQARRRCTAGHSVQRHRAEPRPVGTSASRAGEVARLGRASARHRSPAGQPSQSRRLRNDRGSGPPWAPDGAVRRRRAGHP